MRRLVRFSGRVRLVLLAAVVAAAVGVSPAPVSYTHLTLPTIYSV